MGSTTRRVGKTIRSVAHQFIGRLKPWGWYRRSTVARSTCHRYPEWKMTRRVRGTVTSENQLLPNIGTWVRDKAFPIGESFGEVLDVRRLSGEVIFSVRWMKHPERGGDSSARPGTLGSGFMLGMHVEHIAAHVGRSSLGLGEVVHLRTLGNYEQVLVEFWETGQKVWLPYQHLRMARGV